MTATLDAGTTLPTSDVDPFSHEVLEDPLPMHAALRDAGPVVYLTQYDLYAFARYEQVHAALVDWQEFQSAAGVGTVQLPQREAVAAAEPPAGGGPAPARRPAAGAEQGARPPVAAPAARRLGRRRRALVDQVLATAGRSSTRSPASPRRSRCGCSRTRSGSGRRAGRTCCPTATTRSTRSARATTWSPRARPRVAELSGLGGRPVPAGRARRRGLRRGDLGGRRTAATSPPSRRRSSSGRCSRPASTPRCTASPPSSTRSPPTPTSGSGCASEPSLARVAFDEAVRWESPVQTFFRTATTDVRVGEHVVPDGTQDPDVPRRGQPRPAAVGRTPTRFDLSRDPSGHVGLRHGHPPVRRASTSPGWRPRRCSTALARRVRTIELAGPTRRHHNNTLRAWESIPVRVEPA